MNYEITCVCREKIMVNAENEEVAINKMVEAMDKHIAITEHSEVPKNLTSEQKIGMVKSQIKKV